MGARTVYSPPLRTSTRFPSAACKAATRLVKSLDELANSTMFDDGGVRVTSSLSSQEKVVKAKSDKIDSLNNLLIS